MSEKNSKQGAEHGVAFLDWTVDISEGSTIISKPTSEIESLPKGTEFSVTGTIPKKGYIYVVQANGRDHAVLYPVGAPDLERPNHQVRLPAGDERFRASIDGAVFVVEAERVLTEEDWKALFPVRDPQTTTTHGPHVVGSDQTSTANARSNEAARRNKTPERVDARNTTGLPPRQRR